MNQHIIYESRGEQAVDNFIYEVVYPWIGSHWLIMVSVLACVVVGGLWLSAQSGRRWH
jgi:hypothetical protein